MMRFVVSTAVLSLLVLTAVPRAARAAIDERVPDAESLAALEVKANTARPAEQCFLYAELVHEMIEFSSAEYAAGQVDKASETLKHVNVFTQKIHMQIANDEKRLKNAQVLLQHTAFRLTELLHASAIEDRPLVQQTLADVNQLQTDTMMQVFRK